MLNQWINDYGGFFFNIQGNTLKDLIFSSSLLTHHLVSPKGFFTTTTMDSPFLSLWLWLNRDFCQFLKSLSTLKVILCQIQKTQPSGRIQKYFKNEVSDWRNWRAFIYSCHSEWKIVLHLRLNYFLLKEISKLWLTAELATEILSSTIGHICNNTVRNLGCNVDITFTFFKSEWYQLRLLWKGTILLLRKRYVDFYVYNFHHWVKVN